MTRVITISVAQLKQFYNRCENYVVDYYTQSWLLDKLLISKKQRTCWIFRMGNSNKLKTDVEQGISQI